MKSSPRQVSAHRLVALCDHEKGGEKEGREKEAREKEGREKEGRKEKDGKEESREEEERKAQSRQTLVSRPTHRCEAPVDQVSALSSQADTTL
jgi:hypothetical protein